MIVGKHTIHQMPMTFIEDNNCQKATLNIVDMAYTTR